VLFSVPIAVAALIAIWFVVGSPKAYQSATSLWVDTPPPGVSSLNNTNTTLLTPSAQAQQLLTELLTTRHFRLAVGDEGPLAKYLATHSTDGWGPKALLAKLRGKGSVDDRVFAALGPKQVLTTIAGPQVLGISLQGPTPAVAVGTLQALVDQFNAERKNLDVGRAQSAMAYYQNQVKAAQAGLVSAQTNLANGTASGSDTHALAQAERVAETRLRIATRAFNQTALTLSASRGEQGIFKVIDPIKLPAKSVMKKKKTIFALVAGLFVGAMISFLGIVFVTNREQRAAGASLHDALLRSHDAVVPEAVGTNGSSAETRAPAAAERGGG
jgi:hypothetical protein